MDQIRKKFDQLKVETAEAQAKAEDAEKERKLAGQRCEQVW